jgi:hypothetical protein
MATILDQKYETLAAQFQTEQVRMLKAVLEKHRVPTDLSKRICGEFTFDLSVYFDQGEIALGPDSFRPSVAFTSDEEVFYVQPSGTEFHEYAFGTVEDVFAEL